MNISMSPRSTRSPSHAPWIRRWALPVVAANLALGLACNLGSPVIVGQLGFPTMERAISMSTDDAVAYVGTNGGRVHEIDATTGATLAMSPIFGGGYTAGLAADLEGDGVWALYGNDSLVLWSAGGMNLVTHHPSAIGALPNPWMTTVMPCDVEHLGDERFAFTVVSHDTHPPDDWYGGVVLVDFATGEYRYDLLPLVTYTGSPFSSRPMVSYDDYNGNLVVIMPNATNIIGGHWQTVYELDRNTALTDAPSSSGLVTLPDGAMIVDAAAWASEVTLVVEEPGGRAAWQVDLADLDNNTVTDARRQPLPGTAIALGGLEWLPDNGVPTLLFSTEQGGVTQLGGLPLTQ